MDALACHLAPDFPPGYQNQDGSDREQQELDTEGNPERCEAVQLSAGESAGVQEVEHQANEVDGNEGGDEAANVDDSCCRADPV
ncbi:hypothetical protein PJL18_02653 [Paenarthrobacter nicotinovorans]|nr:hypothetical protein [Paenarthrobacter nicotinovorans]